MKHIIDRKKTSKTIMSFIPICATKTFYFKRHTNVRTVGDFRAVGPFPLTNGTAVVFCGFDFENETDNELFNGVVDERPFFSEADFFRTTIGTYLLGMSLLTFIGPPDEL